ncbi:MAG: ankyrin repeat domain-containing protein [Pseudomonadota bacterium]
MYPRFLTAAIPAVLLAAVATPAQAQRFSDSYQFLEAIRKTDGSKVNEILADPQNRIIDTKDRNSGEGALHIVAKRSDDVYLRFLLQKGANPNLQDDEGNTPMLLAANIGWGAGVEILITYHADVNLGNSRGETPLIRAVQTRNLDLVRILLKAGADPDRADVIAGMSARDYAKADTRSPAITKLLMEAPKVSKRSVSGPTL